MAKRFTDTAKWDKVWFRKLTLVQKCFWFYLLDRCNHAGIWEVDFEFASNYIGAPLNQSEIEKVLGDRIKKLKNNSKWFVPDFIFFQYTELNASNRVHTSVLGILENEGVSKGLVRGLVGLKDKDKAKDKGKDMAKAKGKDKEGKPLGGESGVKRLSDLLPDFVRRTK